MDSCDYNMDFMRAICFFLVSVGSTVSTKKFDPNLAALLVSSLQTFLDMLVGSFRVFSDPSNKWRSILKGLVLLITAPFVVLTYLEGEIADYADGTMLLLVCIHLGYQVRVGLKPIDAF